MVAPVNAGKTALADEIAVLLYEQGLSHALLDLDWLCQAYHPVRTTRLTESNGWLPTEVAAQRSENDRASVADAQRAVP